MFTWKRSTAALAMLFALTAVSAVPSSAVESSRRMSRDCGPALTQQYTTFEARQYDKLQAGEITRRQYLNRIENKQAAIYATYGCSVV